MRLREEHGNLREVHKEVTFFLRPDGNGLQPVIHRVLDVEWVTVVRKPAIDVRVQPHALWAGERSFMVVFGFIPRSLTFDVRDHFMESINYVLSIVSA